MLRRRPSATLALVRHLILARTRSTSRCSIGSPQCCVVSNHSWILWFSPSSLFVPRWMWPGFYGVAIWRWYAHCWRPLIFPKLRAAYFFWRMSQSIPIALSACSPSFIWLVCWISKKPFCWEILLIFVPPLPIGDMDWILFGNGWPNTRQHLYF